MPNTRRRRFSVQNELNARSWPKFQNNLGLSYLENSQDIKIITLDRNKIPQPPKKIVLECAISATNLKSLRKRSTNTMDKNVTASSSNIDLFNILTIAEASKIFPKEPVFSSNVPLEPEPKHLRPEHRQSSRKRTHRVKVRSPKRKIVSPIIEKPPIICERVNTGTNAIVWEQEIEIRTVDMETSFTEPPEEIDRQSSHSIEDMCRICHGGASLNGELGMLVSACACRGTIGRVHVKCLERWLTESGKSRCELCGTRYATRRVHRYGVPRALIMWILSQNAKQLMVDSLGIMLMSPLAVLAAWLSGRTLAGLMTQEPHVTPWPLASTFVLACMTLVCYYCWIVSAATRHALGWWIWYRSQYEVRLQQLENED